MRGACTFGYFHPCMIILMHFSLPGRAWGARKRRRMLLLWYEAVSVPVLVFQRGGPTPCPPCGYRLSPKCVALSLCRVKIWLIINKTYINAFKPPDWSPARLSRAGRPLVGPRRPDLVRSRFIWKFTPNWVWTVPNSILNSKSNFHCCIFTSTDL